MGRTWNFQQRWHHVMNDEVWDKVNDTKWRINIASGQQGQGRSGARVLDGAKHKRCTGQRQGIAPGSHQRKTKSRRARNTLGRPAWPLFMPSGDPLSQVCSSLNSLFVVFKFITQKLKLELWKNSSTKINSKNLRKFATNTSLLHSSIYCSPTGKKPPVCLFLSVCSKESPWVASWSLSPGGEGRAHQHPTHRQVLRGGTRLPSLRRAWR